MVVLLGEVFLIPSASIIDRLHENWWYRMTELCQKSKDEPSYRTENGKSQRTESHRGDYQITNVHYCEIDTGTSFLDDE